MKIASGLAAGRSYREREREGRVDVDVSTSFKMTSRTNKTVLVLVFPHGDCSSRLRRRFVDLVLAPSVSVSLFSLQEEFNCLYIKYTYGRPLLASP